MSSVVGYTRRMESEVTIPEQKRLIQRYCNSNDLALDTIYNDGVDSSGYTTDRGQYQAMLKEIRAGGVDSVIAYGLARLSRDAKDRVYLLVELSQMGVPIYSIKRGGENPVTIDEPWLLTKEATLAEVEDENRRRW